MNAVRGFLNRSLARTIQALRTLVRPNRGPIVRLTDRYCAPLAERLYRRADRVAKYPFRSENIELPPPVEVDGKTIDVVDDLVSFTQLPREEVVHELQTRTAMSFRSEWWATPPDWRFDHWYYLGSKGYLFANASHYPDGDFVEEFVKPNLNGSGRVFDFGAGSGNLSILLAAAGHEVWSTELSALQRDFIRFRAHRNGLADRIHVVDWWAQLPADSFDLGVAVDVIEHVEEPGEILDSVLLPALAPNGVLVERTPFIINDANPMHHADFGLGEHLKASGFAAIQTAVHQYDETRVWRRRGT